MGKLVAIRIYPEDLAKGNQILTTSGPVIHTGSPHTWLVSEEQVKLLEAEEIRFIRHGHGRFFVSSPPLKRRTFIDLFEDIDPAKAKLTG